MEDYESRRHELYNDLERAIGERSAGTLMTSLPPVEWGDLATKADLDAGLASVRTDMASEFKLVRLEMAQLGTELRAEIGQLGTELRAEMTEVRGEMNAGFTLVQKDFSALSTQVAAEVRKEVLEFVVKTYLGLAGLLLSVVALVLLR